VIWEIGDLSCDPTVATTPSSGGGHLVGYSVGIVLVLSVVVGIIITAMLIAFYTVRRHRAKKTAEITRYDMPPTYNQGLFQGGQLQGVLSPPPPPPLGINLTPLEQNPEINPYR
jgi:hypothetical protein